MENKTKIFVSAYACEPGLGSEIGVGWHWIIEMSKYFDLWVLTRKSNESRIENWKKEHNSLSNINFIYFDLPYYLRFWKKGLRGVRLYYNIWQWATDRIVRQTMLENEIKIFHHLTYGNSLWKVSSFGQKQFFVWGPIGGVETIPAEYSLHYDKKSQLIETIRRMVVKYIRLNGNFKAQCRNADLILCKTEDTKYLTEKFTLGYATLFTDVATNTLNYSNNEITTQSDVVKYLIVGRLDPWRGFDIAIEAFDIALKTTPNIHLSIIGKGADFKRLNQLIESKSLSQHITLEGQISMEMYYKRMDEADVILNPSLKEGAVTVSFDSMSMGKPLICTDTGGYTRYFSNEYAIVIPRGDRKTLINNFAKAIIKLSNKEERIEMGKKALDAGKIFTWEARGKQIYETINNTYVNNQNQKL